MFLMIENKGVADVRAFTKLGLSSARDKTDKIGQFGTGAKHGVLTLMRENLNPIIYCGKTKVEFFSQPNTMGDTTYNDMFVKIGQKKPVELSWCLEMGAIDWDNITMGLRELVSNAIDNCDNPLTEVNIKIVDNTRAKDGYTRVFVELTNEVQKFANTIHDRFLHFSGNLHKSIIDKKEPGKAKIYRKGVFVREMGTYSQDALYDYNFGEELKIDECRNSTEWDCRSQAGEVISIDENAIRHMFTRFVDNNRKQSFEDVLSQYSLNNQDWWKDLWLEVAGDNAVIINEDDDSYLTDFAIKKGKTPHRIPSGWYERMTSAGIKSVKNCLSEVENKGCEIIDATDTAESNLDKIWHWFQDFNMTNGKDKPGIMCFSKVVDEDETTLMGYYENETVFINVDFDENQQTYIEELAHYVTGSNDGTRPFQDFAFQFATRMAEMIYA